MTNDPINNPPAFPLLYDGREINSNSFVNNGMTLRDYFAAKAMQSLLSNMSSEASRFTFEERISKIAFMYADAMLKEREK